MMTLVTGGSGYIGSHTCIELIQQGHKIIVVDNLINSSMQAIKQIELITKSTFIFVEGDVRDESLLSKVFTDHKISNVIHFAGLKAVGDSSNDPLGYYDNNISGILTLLKVMNLFGCKNLVFSSSASVYGSQSELPIPETASLSTLNPYGRSKLIIEKILGDLHSSDKLWNIAILRYFNPVGAHESGMIGESPNSKPNNLFPIVSETAAGKRSFIEIYGDDYPTIDGTGVRDYIHIMDLVRGHLSALNMFSQKGCIFSVNLGTGTGYSVLEIIKEFESISGRSIPFKITGRRSGDAAACFADVAYAKSFMDWSSKLTLTKMCEDQWRWQNSTFCKKISN